GERIEVAPGAFPDFGDSLPDCREIVWLTGAAELKARLAEEGMGRQALKALVDPGVEHRADVGQGPADAARPGVALVRFLRLERFGDAVEILPSFEKQTDEGAVCHAERSYGERSCRPVGPAHSSRLANG